MASRSANATEKVLIGSLTIVLIVAAMDAESMPPDRNIPSGTSDMSRMRTASRKRSPYSAISDSSDCPFVAELRNSRSQYCSMRTCPSRQRSEYPAGRRRMPSNSVSSPDGAWFAR